MPFARALPPRPWAAPMTRRELAKVALAGAALGAAGWPASARAASALPPGDADVRYVLRLVDDPALDSVYVHLRPDTASDVVWSVPYGTPVAVLSQADGQKLWYGGTTWYELALPYGTGWIYGPLLGDDPPPYAAPPMPSPVPAPPTTPAPVGSGRSIVVSLADQFLWAFDGEDAVLSVACTTGGAGLETPAGDFTVKRHVRNYQFNSPWPKGSFYYYDSVEASYALLFYERSYFLHDAPWRRVFGPASRGGTGKLGKDHTGSHGCVNLPYPAARFLYGWAQDGMPVRVA